MAFPTAPAQASYALAPGVRVLTLDDDAVVFNPFSWETHVLNPAAALVLDMAAQRPCTLQGLSHAFAELLSAEEQPHADGHARRLLGELVSLRLLVASPLQGDAGR
jgi:PqqD family protein of HPr-rel-A system